MRKASEKFSHAQVRLAAAMIVSATMAMIASVLLHPEGSPVALLTTKKLQHRNSRAWAAPLTVRAPGDDGVGGHGIGGKICWYETNQESGLAEWTCDPTTALFSGTLPSTIFRHPRAARHDVAVRTQPRHLARLFDFGAPPKGYTYSGALPPMDWGENFDGKNFGAFNNEDDLRGISSYAPDILDGDFWQSVHAGAPTPLPFDLDEGGDGRPLFSDDSWNPNIFCQSGVCDYTSDSTPGAFDIDEWMAPVKYTIGTRTE